MWGFGLLLSSKNEKVAFNITRCVWRTDIEEYSVRVPGTFLARNIPFCNRIRRMLSMSLLSKCNQDVVSDRDVVVPVRPIAHAVLYTRKTQ